MNKWSWLITLLLRLKIYFIILICKIYIFELLNTTKYVFLLNICHKYLLEVFVMLFINNNFNLKLFALIKIESNKMLVFLTSD